MNPMPRRSSKQFALIIFIFASLMTTVSLLSAQNSTPLPLPSGLTSQAKPLFVASDNLRQSLPLRAYLGVLRSRTVSIDSSALGVNQANLTARHSSTDLSLNLFDDLTLTALNTSLEPRWNAPGYLWNGRLAEDPYSSVVLVYDGSQLTGEINFSEGTYLLRPAGNGELQIIEVSPAQMIEPTGSDVIVMPKLAAETLPTSVNQNAPLPLRDAQTTIDIMVVYTPTAASQLGGESSTRAVIDSLVAFANQAYASSGVSHRLRLVHTEQVSYTEQGIVNDLYAITGKDDRSLNEVHDLRNLYQADLVTLLASNGSCGIGFLLNEMQSYAADFAFNVVDTQCATGRTLAHEIGHNLGAQHDVHNTESGGITPYAYGYQDPEGDFATIMAYSVNGACGQSCPRVPYFANPNLSFHGKPLGSAEANIARVFNETAPFVAGYRSGTAVGFHLLAPGDQTALSARESLFTWQAETNAEQYTLKIKSEDGSYKYKIKLDPALVCNAAQCAYSAGEDLEWTPKANTSHRWFVKTKINGLSVSSDEKWTFSNNFLPETIHVSSPVNGQNLNSTAMGFNWQADERLTDYVLKVNDTNDDLIARQKFAAGQICTFTACSVDLKLDVNAASGGYHWTLIGKRAGVLGKVKAKSSVQLQR